MQERLLSFLTQAWRRAGTCQTIYNFILMAVFHRKASQSYEAAFSHQSHFAAKHIGNTSRCTRLDQSIDAMVAAVIGCIITNNTWVLASKQRELPLRARLQLEMEAAKYSLLGRVNLVILNKPVRFQAKSREGISTKGLREKPARIGVLSRSDQDHILDFQRLKIHVQEPAPPRVKSLQMSQEPSNRI